MTSPSSAAPPPVLVLKFGGTSVADAPAFRRVAEVIDGARGRGRPVVVTSAMAGVTDGLLAAVAHATAGDLDAALRELDGIVERHRSVAESLLGTAAAVDFAARVDEVATSVPDLLRVASRHPGTRLALQDEIVSHGERLSSGLLALALAEAGLPASWVDARQVVRTDGEHTRAAPLRAPTDACAREILLPLVSRGQVPVLGGFIASTLQGATTTLGRGGSDFTAALVGAALGAAEIEIWTDVNGFLTADPRLVPEAHNLAHLSYEEAAELAYFGAKVLHPRTIQPAVELGLPVRVRNSRRPEEPGTRIDGNRKVSPQGIKAIAHKRGITILQVTSARMLGAYGFLRALFEVFDRHRTPVDIVTTSEVSVSLTIDERGALPAIVADLEKLGEVREEEERHAIVCVVGEGLRTTAGIAAKVFGALSDINVSLISQGASSTNLTFAVSEERVTEVVVRLHRTFFGAS